MLVTGGQVSDGDLLWHFGQPGWNVQMKGCMLLCRRSEMQNDRNAIDFKDQASWTDWLIENWHELFLLDNKIKLSCMAQESKDKKLKQNNVETTTSMSKEGLREQILLKSFMYEIWFDIQYLNNI